MILGTRSPSSSSSRFKLCSSSIREAQFLDCTVSGGEVLISFDMTECISLCYRFETQIRLVSNADSSSFRREGYRTDSHRCGMAGTALKSDDLILEKRSLRFRITEISNVSQRVARNFRNASLRIDVYLLR